MAAGKPTRGVDDTGLDTGLDTGRRVHSRRHLAFVAWSVVAINERTRVDVR
jgi:hypothetical protein